MSVDPWGEKIQTIFCHFVFSTILNDLLQIGYIDVGPGKNDAKYILFLRGDQIGYYWLLDFPKTKAENGATAMIDWCDALGVANGLMSDGPTKLNNEVLGNMAKGHKLPHHFTLPYCPWSNGESSVSEKNSSDPSYLSSRNCNWRLKNGRIYYQSLKVS